MTLCLLISIYTITLSIDTLIRFAGMSTLAERLPSSAIHFVFVSLKKEPFERLRAPSFTELDHNAAPALGNTYNVLRRGLGYPTQITVPYVFTVCNPILQKKPGIFHFRRHFCDIENSKKRCGVKREVKKSWLETQILPVT